jgi:ligand-binding sensor domain-containing protein/serine phosphatase RsbU (regulator of sigma subunit)
VVSYQTSDGLSTNLTKAAVRDKQGFVWLATDDGVVKFDGKTFETYKQGLPSNYNKSLMVSATGKVLICNDFGILELVHQSDTVFFKTIVAGATDATHPDKVHYPKTIFESSNQDLWVSEPTSIFRRFANGKTKRYRLPAKYHTNNFVRSFSLTETANHTIWAVSYTGFLLKYNRFKDTFEEIALDPTQPLVAASSILAVDAHTLWVGTADGIFSFDVAKAGNTELASQQLYPMAKNVSVLMRNADQILVGTWDNHLFQVLLKSQQIKPVENYRATVVNHIFTDQEQNVWVSSDEGLVLLAKNDFEKLPLASSEAYTEGVAYAQGKGLLVCDGSKIHLVRPQKNAFQKEILYQAAEGGLNSVAYSRHSVFVGNRNGQVICINDSTKVAQYIDLSKFGKSVFSMYADTKGNIWACQYDQKEGLVKIDTSLKVHHYDQTTGIKGLATVIRQNAQGQVYVGAKGKATYLYTYDAVNDKFKNVSLPLGLKSTNKFAVNDLCFDAKGQLWLATTHGLWLQSSAKKIEKVDLGTTYQQADIKSIVIDATGMVWLGTHVGVIKWQNSQVVLFNKNTGLSTETVAYRGLELTPEGWLFVGTAKGLNYTNTHKITTKITPTPTFMTLSANQQLLNWQQKHSALEFTHNTTLEGQFTSFTYPNEAVLYQYRILGLLDKWSEASHQNHLTIARLPAGGYTLELRAKQQGNYAWSAPLSLDFKVKQAWYFTPLAFIIYVVALGILIWVVTYFNTQRLRWQKQKLEGLVEQRTTELAAKNDHLQQAYDLVNDQKIEITTRNEELQQQQEELASQRDFIVEKNEVLERQSRQIQMSINAALTIQKAILPYQKKLDTLLKDYFVLYRPKDVVSGDFYWLNEIDGKTIFVVADCTGHGVPGAFMTLIGNTLLDKIVRVWKIINPADVLETLHREVVTVLRQTHTGNSNGMDAVVMQVQNGKYPLQVTLASAKMPIFCKRKEGGALERIKGDRRHIGGIQKGEKRFTNKTIELHPGDMIYAGSDGYTDQCNSSRKSFGTRRFMELINQVSELPLASQQQQFEQAMDHYMEGAAQRDDILLIGVRVS